jgi:hypothetical protein
VPSRTPLPPIDQIVTLGKISGPLLRRAVKIEDYATPHALAAFGLMTPDPAYPVARRILILLKAGAWDKPAELGSPIASFTRRALHRKLEGSFPRIADLQPGLDLLVEYGWLAGPPGPRPIVAGQFPIG